MEQPDAASTPDGSVVNPPADGASSPGSEGGTMGDASAGGDDASTPGSDAGAGPSASSFVRVGFYNQHLAVGADDRVHLTFLDGAAERLHYASCTERCGEAESWQVTQLLSVSQLSTITIGPYGIAVDSSGRLHMLASAVARAGQHQWELMYGTCAANCGSAPSWTFVDLSALAPNRSLITSVDTLMVRPNGRVSFLTAGVYNSVQPAYFECDGNCTQASQWRAINAPINGKPLRAALDSTGVTHVIFAGGRSDANEELLQYARCAGSCTNAASWQSSMLGFLYVGADYETGFAIDSSNRLFVAYNQGTIAQASTVNRRNLIASCAGGDCLNLDRWSSVPVGDLEEGVGGNTLVRAGGGLVLASVLEREVRVRSCDSNCATAEAWSAASTIDNSDAIARSVAPDLGSSCPGRSESAAWWPRNPALAVNSRGIVAVHNPHAIVKCPGDVNPMRVPPIGRVFASF